MRFVSLLLARITGTILLTFFTFSPAIYADSVSGPVQIGSSTSSRNVTLGMPRWKGYMLESDPGQFWATYSNGSRSSNNISYTTDGGDTWNTNSIQIDPLGYLDMHMSVAGQNGNLYTTWPNREGIVFRKFNAPAHSNDDADTPRPIWIDGTEARHRSNVMVEPSGRVWVFTRQTDNPSENVLYHYTDDDGLTWQSGTAYATNASEVRFGSMQYIDGRPALVVLYLNSDRGYEYYLWNGSSFEAMPDHAMYARNVGFDRAFTHNVVNDSTMHLVFGVGNELHHVWKDFNNGTGSWVDEVIETSPATTGNDWYPMSSVRGDDLYLFYCSRSSADDASSEVFYRKWSQTARTWTDPVLVSTDAASVADMHPNTTPRVPDNSPYVPVFWQSGNGPYGIQFAKIIVDDTGGGGGETGLAPEIDCPTSVLTATDCGPGLGCVPLTITNYDSVTVSPSGATWSNGQLQVAMTAEGTFDYQVTAYPADSGFAPATCNVSVFVDLPPGVEIDCPTGVLTATECGPGLGCVPLAITNYDSVTVSPSGATWSNGQLQFGMTAEGTFNYQVTAFPADPNLDSATCNVAVFVDLPPIVEIACPTTIPEFQSCYPTTVQIDLPITDYVTVDVTGANWSNEVLSFLADTSGTYSYMVTASDEFGSVNCEVVATVAIGPAADLSIADSDLSASETMIPEGDTVTLSATVHSNPNSRMVTDIDVMFYDGDPAAGGTLLGTGGPVPALNGGEQASVAVLYAGAGVGFHDIHVVVDGNMNIAECDETNNAAMLTIEVIPASADSATAFGTVMTETEPASGVMVELLDEVGTVLQSTTTDASGQYRFDLFPAGSYIVDMQVPLGYSPVGSPSVPVAWEDDDLRIEFALQDAASGDVSDFWLWKQEFDYIRNGIEPRSGLTRDDVDTYCESIFRQYCDRNDGNGIQIEGVTGVSSPMQAMTFDDIEYLWFDITDNRFPARARKYMLACLLNVASERRHQQEVVTADGATASQAITYFANQYLAGDSSQAYIWYSLRQLFTEEMIPAGVVPLSTIDILYKPGHADSSGTLPGGFALGQNYPNPFNPTTTIEFTLAKKAHVSLEVLNVLGQRVKTLVQGQMTAGTHSVEWDGTDGTDSHLASGIYFYRLSTGEGTDVKKMLMVK